jgi:hypothetical protein
MWREGQMCRAKSKFLIEEFTRHAAKIQSFLPDLSEDNNKRSNFLLAKVK